MTQVRIGEIVIHLEQCTFIQGQHANGSPTIEIYFQGRQYTFLFQKTPGEYKILKTYMERQETLEQYNAREEREREK